MPKKAKYSAFLLMWTFVIFAVTFAIPGDMVIVKAIILIAENFYKSNQSQES